jgi:hypothetical protein
VVAIMALAFAAAAVASDPTITYTGQGFSADGTINTQKCDAPDNGGTGATLVPNQNYLLWVLTLNANPAGGVTLHLPDGEHQMIQVGGTWKFVSEYFTRDALVALPAHATFSGGGTPQLTVSHGCQPGAVDSHVVTAIHSGATDSGTPAAITTADLGATVHDSAAVTVDNNVPIPSGSTVTFSFYDGDGNLLGTETDPVGATGSVDPALAKGPLGAGSYKYTAVFTSGNENVVKSSTAADEPLTINKAQLKITTQIHGVNGAHSDVGGADTHVALGSTVHDTATVTGQVDGFGIGAVSFTRDGAAVDNDPTADGTATARSVESAALAAGDYTYQASVAGNANYEGGLSADEPLTVDKKDTTVVTQVHDAAHSDITGKSVASGITVHDSSTVNGAIDGFPLTGSVTYRLYNNGTCSVDPVSTEGPLAVGTESSGVVTTNGAWGYKVTYSGGANYNESVGECEPFSVLTFGKTMGFWGNQNGIAKIIAGGGYLANAVNIGRGANIDTQAEATKVLPNSLNACGKGTPSIFTVGAATGTANCTLATGVNINSLNTLAAQTLALGYNIKLVAGYDGQTIAGLGSTAFLTAGLTGTSTVQAAFNAAVALINGSAAGGTTTQAQIGAMNALLGSLNREA